MLLLESQAIIASVVLAIDVVVILIILLLDISNSSCYTLPGSHIDDDADNFIVGCNAYNDSDCIAMVSCVIILIVGLLQILRE